MISQKSKTVITAVLSIALVVAGAAYLICTRFGSSIGVPEDTVIGDQDVFNASLARLSTADNSQERLQAARWLGEQSSSVNSHLVQALALSLTSDPDPSVRAAVANTFGELASRHNGSAATSGPQEPQIISILSAAYNQEGNASVRRCIVVATGQFNHPTAVRLLNKALIDQDPSVKEAAQEAKLKRQRRQLLSTSG